MLNRMFHVLLAVLLLLTGCSWSKAAEMPLEMPEDFNFVVRFGYGEVTKNEINTYEGIVTKDLISKGSATAELTFTDEEMKEIYNKMREIKVMSEKDTSGSRNCTKVPSNEDDWTITTGGVTKSLSWTDKYCVLTDDAKDLLVLREFIQQLAESKEAYQSLPEAEGGYD